MAAAEPPVTYREPGRDGGGAPVPEPGRPLPVAMLYRHATRPSCPSLQDNRRMTDAAHNQHSENRRPSNRDRT